MPRAKRARRAPAPSAKAIARSPSPDANDSGDNEPPQQSKSPERGRRRTTRSSGARTSLANEQDVLAADGRRDAALDELAKENPTSTASKNVEDADSGSSVEGGRRLTATPKQRRDTTGLDLADSVFGDLDNSFGLDDDDDTRPGLRSADASSLNLSNFKRRPRQSSIIGRNDPPIRPSSRGGNTPSISSTLHFGAFKRRAREPSILGTARKARPENAAGQEPDSESEDEDEDQFMPEAESTPVNNRRRTQPRAEIIEVPASIEIPTSPEVTGSKHRKRKSEDALPSSERPEKISRIESDAEEESEDEAGPAPEVIDSDNESDSSLSDLASPLGPSPVIRDRPVTPVNDEELMALPASSDSEDVNWPDIHTLAKRRRRPSVTTPIRADNFSDVSSPPSLTHSPNYGEVQKTRGRAGTKRKAPSPKITTADLTNLLPKRHYQKKRDPLGLESDEEHDTSGIGENEDELSYLDGRAARRKRGGQATSRGGPSRPASRGGRTAQAPKAKQTASGKQAARNAQTYSRRSSDKENENEEGSGDDEEDQHENSRFQPLPDDTFGEGSAENASTPSADELRQAAKKFKEVDRWELDFEEVTQSSSPLAR
jgi:ATP-dependent RNA helicase MRH4